MILLSSGKWIFGHICKTVIIIECYILAELVIWQFHFYFSKMLYHGLRGSASPALTATGLVNGKEQILTHI